MILRSKRNQSPSLETLLDCAQLALHCSSRRDAWSADIHYTQKKNVTKPKGAKPGLVLVHSHKTLSVKRDEKRLDRRKVELTAWGRYLNGKDYKPEASTGPDPDT